MEYVTQITAALQNLEGFEGLNAQKLEVQRLGGLTNLVYRVEGGPQIVIVRIPGEGTEEYIDRSVEIHNAEVAADAGVGPLVLWADPETGVMISQCVQIGRAHV